MKTLEKNMSVQVDNVVICGYIEDMENTTISPQQISRIIGKTNITKSHTYKSGRKGQGRRSTEGFSVHTGIEGVVISYTITYGHQSTRRDSAMETIATTLTQLGFTLEPSTIWPSAIVVKAGK
jgi:hypothetical protein